MVSPESSRKACTGSCHCGFIQYIVYLTLPHPFSSSNPPRSTDQEIYRCNCTTCHKMGFLHVHPANPRADFVILSPLDPEHALSLYQCNDKKRKYYFCPTCGVRCFTLSGTGVVTQIDPSTQPDVARGKDRIWHIDWDGQHSTRPYIAINGSTINTTNDLDLRELTEERKVQYFDGKTDPEEAQKEARWNRPHYGGSY